MVMGECRGTWRGEVEVAPLAWVQRTLDGGGASVGHHKVVTLARWRATVTRDIGDRGGEQGGGRGGSS